MNDRAQAGSVLRDGWVELMQNRKLCADDERGVDERMDEREPNNYSLGVSVPATYYVQLFDHKKRKSLQRTIQQRLDAPAQQFFSFDGSHVKSNAISEVITKGYDEILRSAGFTDEFKLEMFVEGRNKLMVRIENIADVYDSQEVKVDKVDVWQLMTDLYQMVNGEHSEFSVELEELSLTGNQKKADM